MGPPPPNGTASPGPNSGDPYGRPGWNQYGPRPGYPPQSGHPPGSGGPPTSSSFGSSGPGGPYPDQYHVSKKTISFSLSFLSSVLSVLSVAPIFFVPAFVTLYVHSAPPPLSSHQKA